MTKTAETVIKVGVSACLLGHQVRYDGGHKRNSFLIEELGKHVEMVMAHSQAAYQRMGKLLSNLSRNRLEAITDEYAQELMTTLKRRVNCKRHVNVLQHIMGYLKKRIDSEDKAELERQYRILPSW